MPSFLDPSTNFASTPRPPNGDYAGNVTADGGRAGGVQIRFTGHAWYDDTTGAALDGPTLPNARFVSNTVFKQTDASGAHIDMPNSKGVSSLLWVWGQFIDHDMTQTATSISAGRVNITLPADDPMRAAGVTELNFVRSGFVAGTGTGTTAREFPNQITSFLDASMVYGSSQAKLDALLVPGTAKLRLSAEGTILFDQGDAFFGNSFIAGDTRANENVGLLSMQSLFAREHNRIVDALKAADPTLTVAEQFEGARARVEALVQVITYNEYLPKLIGSTALPAYTGFDSTVNPAISLEFSTAVYRLGHTLLSNSIHRIDETGATDSLGHLALLDAFQTRGVVEQTGIEDILRGMATTRSQSLDTFMVEDVRSFLFNAGGGAFGNDLAALNIQRTRDHGMPSYNEMRVALGLAPKASFAAITGNAEVAARLQAAYGTIDKLDLWVGGLAENPVGDGLVGETFRAVLVDQFARLRAGDPQFSLIRGFSADELNELWSTSLSDVIMRNSAVGAMQDDAMLAYNRIGGGAGPDTLTGIAGRNLLIGFAGDDTLEGGADADHLVGGAGVDQIFGNAGDDVMIGGAGTDLISGGAGDDLIRIVDTVVQRDTIDGGSGTDRIEFYTDSNLIQLPTTNLFTGVEIFDGGGRTVQGTTKGDVLDFSIFTSVTGVIAINGKGGNDRILGLNGVETLNGGSGDDTLLGGGGDDIVNGNKGIDDIRGGAGADTINGGPGNDLIDGGTGDDVILFAGDDAKGDRIDGGAGVNDVLRATGTGDFILRDTGFITNVEILEGNGKNLLGDGSDNTINLSVFHTVTGAAAISGIGGDDVIVGTNGADSISGGAGADLLDGRLGSDTLNGGGDPDTFRFVASTAGGADTIVDFDAIGSGNDVVLLVGYSGLSGLGGAAQLLAVEAATSFSGAGATIDFSQLGGAGQAFLAGVTTASLTFTSEDFLFG